MKQIPNEELNKWLKGKTLCSKAIDVSAANCSTMFFTDGSRLLIEGENIGMGLVGPVYYELERNDNKFGEGKIRKGGQNPPNTSSLRPPVPGGSGVR